MPTARKLLIARLACADWVAICGGSAPGWGTTWSASVECPRTPSHCGGFLGNVYGGANKQTFNKCLLCFVAKESQHRDEYRKF